MSYEDQVRQIVIKATEVAGRTPDPWRQQEIARQALRVSDLLTKDPDDLIFGPWGPSTCLEWGRYDAGLMQRANYRMTCLNWSDALRRALDKLADLLTPVDAGQAEAARSAGVQAQTMDTQSKIVPTSTDLWANTPTWVKAVLIGGVAVITVKAATDLLQAVGAARSVGRAAPAGAQAVDYLGNRAVDYLPEQAALATWDPWADRTSWHPW